MDTPDRPPAWSSAAASEDSHVFDFINSLSPIATPKPLDAVPNVQLLMLSDLAPVSSIFTSPQVNLQKESKLSIRDASAQLSQEGLSPHCQRIRIGTSSYIKLSRSTTIASENCSIDCSLNEAYHDSPENASILSSNLSQSIQLDSNTLGNDKKHDTDGKTDCTADQEHTELSSICFDHSGLDKMESSTSGRNVQENDLAKQYNGKLAACNWDHLITHCGSSVVPKSDLSFEREAQLANRTLETDGVISSESFLPIDEANLENSRRKLFHGSTGYYIQSSVGDIHVYCAGGGEGVATNYDTGIPPGANQIQLVSNHQICDKLEVPSDYMPMDRNIVSRHLHGMRRRLFNEKVRASTMSAHSVSNLHPASCTTRCKSIGDDNYLKPVGSPLCTLPGIGFHLNALAPISEDVVPYNNQATGDSSNNMSCTVNTRPLIYEHNSQMKVISGNQLVLHSSEVDANIQNDHSSQTMPTNADESGQESPKKKRHKFQNNDGDSCKRCSCKKSKCLKLYCQCFAAKVYCSEFCSCRCCLNNHTHEETVLSTRKQTESRNPLAFAPKVIHACGSGQEFGEDSNKTPTSARHKRGCNCMKSSCLKKYCECFQSGVGCSSSCRCESCKNAFGIRMGVQLLATEEIERVNKENNVHANKEQPEVDKQHVIGQTGDLPSTENLLTTPLIGSCRSLARLPSTCSRPPLSSIRYYSRLHNSQSPMKTDVSVSPFESYAEMILGNSQEEGSSCTASTKVVSPNKKRVSPLRIGTSLSPISGRKLILNSIPSFPSLTGDVNNEPK